MEDKFNIETQDASTSYTSEVAYQQDIEFLNSIGVTPQNPQEEGARFKPSLGRDIIKAPQDVYTGLAKGVNELVENVGDIFEFAPELTYYDEQGNKTDKIHLTTIGGRRDRLEKAGFERGEDEIIPEFERPEQGALGKMVTGVSQFLGSFGAVGKGAKALGIAKSPTVGGRVVQEMSKGAIADVLAFDEKEERLSNMIESVPALQNPVTDFLAAEEDDTFAEGKVKQALEGAGLGLAVDGVVRGLKGIKQLRKVKQTLDEIPEDEMFEAAEMQSKEMLSGIRSTLSEGVDEGAAYSFKTPDIDPSDVKAGKAESPEIFINFDRITGPEEIKEVMENMANDEKLIESIKAARRGVRSDADLLKEANDIDGFQTLINRRTGEGLNDAQTMSARTLYYSTTKRLMELSKKASDPNATPADVFAFRKIVAAHHAVQKEILGARAEAARALRAWSIPVGDETLATKELEEIMATYGGIENSKDLAKRVAKLGSRAHTGQLNAITEGAALARTGDALVESWTLGLLTNPQTHVVNVSSNTLTGLYLGMERGYLALTTEEATMKETINYFMGYTGSLKDALVASGRAYKTGVVDIGAGTKVDLPIERKTAKAVLDPRNKAGYISDAVNYYGKILEYASGRVLAAGDAFGKTMLYQAQVRALATKEGIESGLDGKELAEFIAEKVSNPSKKLIADGVDFAEYGTFVKPLGPVGRDMQRMVAKAPALRFVAPFIRTPVNIFKFTFSRTPLAYASSSIRDAISKGGRVGADAQARIALGSGLLYTAMDFAANGHITGSGPNDPQARKMLRQRGWQPYSIKVGDKYYSYSRFEPIATLFGMGADLAEIMTNYDAYDTELQNDIDSSVTAFSIVAANQLVGKTFLSGVADTAELLADPKRKAGDWLNRMSGSFVPAGVAAVERAVSPEMESKRPFNLLDFIRADLDAIRARVPGISEDMPKRRDAFGEPIVYVMTNEQGDVPWSDRMINFFNPMYISKEKRDVVVDSIFKEGLYVPDVRPSQSISVGWGDDVPDNLRPYMRSIPINLKKHPEIYEDLILTKNKIELPRYNNLTYKQALRELIDGNLPDSFAYTDPMTSREDKQKILNRISSQYTKAAKKDILPKYPELQTHIIKELEKVRATAEIQK